MKSSHPELGPDAVDRLAELVRAEHEAQEPVHSGYEIQCMLAQGGMGTVYLVQDRKLKRQVAMKVMTIQDDALRDQFYAEAVSTANLQHPNILPVFDYGKLEDGRLFYTMKLIEGRSLKEWIEEFHASEAQIAGLPTLLRILCQVCEAVSYAHERGAIHRDLKPDNIMVGEFNQVWVVDWGLAKLVSHAVPRLCPAEVTTPQIARGDRPFETQASHVCGTPAYMAPEQARGHVETITPLVDVYSAGTVLFEILSGRPPYAGLPGDQILERLRAGQTPALAAGTFPIPAPLRSVVQKAMAPDPECRYQTAQQLAADLQRWMDRRPVAAHQENWLERLSRIGSRYSAAIAIVVFYLVTRVIILLTTGR